MQAMTAPATVIDGPRPAAAASAKTEFLARVAPMVEMLAGNAAQHDADDSFVASNYAHMKQQGFFRAHVPAELGGFGLSHHETCALVRQLAAGCGATGLTFAMHSHLVAFAAWRWRSEGAPTDKLLRRVAVEDLVLVSTGATDWLPSGGTAEKVEGGFRVTARKTFCSGAPAGDLLMTSAVQDDPQAGPTVLHFAVPFKAEGVTVHDTWRAMAMRGTGSHDVELNGVFVPDAAVSARRPQGKWHHMFHTISMVAFPVIYSAYLGVAGNARDRALEIARAGKCDDGRIRQVGEMENALTATRLAVAEMIDLAESATPGAETTSRTFAARTLAGDAAIRTVECAMEVVGGTALFRARGIERAFRDIQGARYHALRREPQLRLAGRIALGLDIDG
jgi:alkylation response protein AidB-like acyl-CoA dehydrogenase